LPFREARAHLTDIRESIENIDGFLEEMTSTLIVQTSKLDRQSSGNCRSFRRLLLGSKTMERGFALGLTGKGCVEWETFSDTATTRLKTESYGMR
jgi:hypothetical protein